MSDSVLIVERNHEVGKAIKSMVQAAGHRAISVCSVAAALTELSQRSIDVVMTSSLYTSAEHASLPWLAKQMQPAVAVVLTGSGGGINVNDFGSLDGCLPKPFSIADIEAIIARLGQR